MMVLHRALAVLVCLCIFTPVVEENSTNLQTAPIPDHGDYSCNGDRHLYSPYTVIEVDWNEMWSVKGIENLNDLWTRLTESFLIDHDQTQIDSDNWYSYWCGQPNNNLHQSWTDILSQYVWEKQADKQDNIWYTSCGVLEYVYSHNTDSSHSEVGGSLRNDWFSKIGSYAFDIIDQTMDTKSEIYDQSMDKDTDSDILVYDWVSMMMTYQAPRIDEIPSRSVNTVYDRVSRAMDIHTWSNWMRGFVLLVSTILMIELNTGGFSCEVRIFWFRMYTAPRSRLATLKKCAEEEEETRENFLEMYCKSMEEASAEESYCAQTQTDMEKSIESQKIVQLEKDLELAQKYILTSRYELLMFKQAYLESQNKKTKQEDSIIYY